MTWVLYLMTICNLDQNVLVLFSSRWIFISWHLTWGAMVTWLERSLWEQEDLGLIPALACCFSFLRPKMLRILTKVIPSLLKTFFRSLLRLRRRRFRRTTSRRCRWTTTKPTTATRSSNGPSLSNSSWPPSWTRAPSSSFSSSASTSWRSKSPFSFSYLAFWQ